MSLFEQYFLHTTEDKFYIQPIANAIDEVLIIDRIQNDFKLTNSSVIPIHANRRLIYGILGVMKLISGPYLIIISSKSKAGMINGEEIWKIDQLELLSYTRNDNHLNDQQKKFNSTYKNLVETIFKFETFYFSYSYDITHSLQRLQNTTPEFLMTPLFVRADERFLWNCNAIRNFNSPREIARYLVPVILGYVSTRTSIINGKAFELTLISRRSVFRAGTRFFTRGADYAGKVANFVETEQILQYGDVRCSYVQIRGSIPIVWNQYPNLKYKPPMSIQEVEQIDICRKHFKELSYIYDRQVVCINLINQSGSEGRLEKAFEETIKAINDPMIRYEAFDFHKQCGIDKWDRLSILINRLANDQDSFSYFCIKKDGTVVATQQGSFRTNCIDCLDRTNVVQGLLGKRILHIQLLKLGILNEHEAVETHEYFHNEFRNLWADNGDILSKQYAGTGALKSDFTRTGQRTTYGALRDGANSLYRYVINNFYDGSKQDAIDLFLGNYQIAPGEGLTADSCPVSIEKDKRFLALPVVGLGALSMFIISLLIPAETYQEQFMYVFFWGFATVCTLGIMLYFGHEIVNSPKLTIKKAKNE